MKDKKYDFTSFNYFLNNIAFPNEVCDNLIDLAFSHTDALDDSRTDEFKDGMNTIRMLYGEFKKLAAQQESA